MAGIDALGALGPRRIVASSTATAMGSIGAQGALGPRRIVANPRDGTDRSFPTASDRHGTDEHMTGTNGIICGSCDMTGINGIIFDRSLARAPDTGSVGTGRGQSLKVRPVN